MKRRIVSIVLSVVVCLLVAACSRPEEEKRETRSAWPENTPSVDRPSPPPIDPWKAASEWAVPIGPVGDAQRFLRDAPAYQYTSDWEDLNTHRKGHGEGRVVRNGAVWIEGVGAYGKNGIITDGKIEFVFYRGRYGKEPGDAAATLTDQLKGASLQSLLDQSEEHSTLLGPDKVDGVEAEVYALSGRQGGRLLPPTWAWGGGHLRVWVAKEDHRPLKVERKENYSNPQRPGATQASIETRTYRYDPNVKVTLPGP